jgi:hypothetical protein
MTDFINISKVKMPAGVPKINYNKKNGTYEVSCSLFAACNLNCNFCFQDHSNWNIDINKIMAMPKRIVDTIKNDIHEYEVDRKIYIRIWGGEIFFDALPGSMFDTYFKFYTELKSRMNEAFPQCAVEVYWASNGVFEKYDRVEKLLKNTNGFLTLSYDAFDRFKDDAQKDVWLKTLNYFHSRELLSTVSITLTKPMIMACLNGDKYFEQIPASVTIDVNDFIAGPKYEKYIVNDDDVFSFYVWCIDNHKFNIVPVASSITNYLNKKSRHEIERYCYCKCSNLFYADGGNVKDCVNKYSELPRECFYGQYSDATTEGNCTEVKNYLGLTKRGCLTCGHYDYCWMTCWTSVIFEGYKTNVCPIKRLYQCLGENRDIITHFLRWRETNERPT